MQNRRIAMWLFAVIVCVIVCGLMLRGAMARADGADAGLLSYHRSTNTVPSPASDIAVRVNDAKVLRIGDPLDVPTLNPHLAALSSLSNLSQLTMAYLVRYGKDNRPVPELALDVPSKSNHLVSQDGRTIVWHLRHHVRWSDGAPFDADDVLFSTRAILNPRNNEAQQTSWNLVSRIDEPDRFTVIFHLRRPLATLEPTFFGTADANPCILPKHLLGSLPSINHAAYNDLPVGIGPFRYTRWVHGDHVELEANPYYWRGIPKIKRIVYKFIPDANTLYVQLQTGEIDMWPGISAPFYDRVSRLTHIRITRVPSYGYLHLDFNLVHPVTSDAIVRTALRLAVDRAEIRRKTFHNGGSLQEGMISPASALYTRFPLIAFDLARARVLLDSDGWRVGPDGIREKRGRRLSLDFAAPSGQPDFQQMVELIRSTWRQIGVELNARFSSPALLFAASGNGGIISAGRFDVTMFGWGGPLDGDLTPLLACNQFPPNGQNDLHYCNSSVDGLLAKAATEYDERKRKVIVAAVQREVIKDAPLVVMGFGDDVYAYNSRVTGWHPNSATPFDNMLGVDM